MSDRIYLNYDDIVKEESVVVDYLAKNSDRFSVTAVIKRPYSQLPPDFNYGVQLQPFVENYIFERKDWLVNFLGYMRHQIMVFSRMKDLPQKQV